MVELYIKKNCQNQIKQGLELKDYYRKKVTNFIPNGKVMIILLTVGLITKTSLYKMSQYFPKPYELSSKSVKFKSDPSNYTTKAGLKGVRGVDTSNRKSDLASFKAKVYKIDTDKLKTVPVDLSKLSNVAIMMLSKVNSIKLSTATWLVSKAL